MSRIVEHVLDPYNVTVLTSSDDRRVKTLIAEDLTSVVLSDVFGIGKCNDWDNVLSRYLIIDMFSSTDATTLDASQLSCLTQKVFKGLNNSLPCNNQLYSS